MLKQPANSPLRMSYPGTSILLVATFIACSEEASPHAIRSEKLTSSAERSIVEQRNLLNPQQHATLTHRQRAAYDGLVELNPEWMNVRPGAENGLSMIVAKDLTLPACTGDSGQLQGDEKSIRWMSNCFLREAGELFLRKGATLDPTSVRVEKVVAHPNGEHQVHLAQYVGETPVKDAALNLFFIDGRLVSASGDLFELADIKVGSTDAKVFEQIGRRALQAHSGPVKCERRVDARLGAFVWEVFANTEMVTIREDDRAIVRKETAGMPQSSEVTRTLKVHRYDQAFLPANVFATVQRDTLVRRDCGTGGCGPNQLCRFYPSLIDTSVGNLSGRNASVRTVEGKSVESVFFADYWCTGQPFNSPSAGSSAFYANNLHYHLMELKEMFEAPQSYFYYAHSNEELVAKLEPNLGWAGLYTSFDNKLHIDHTPGSSYADSLLVIAHEYGHFIHDMYGSRGSGAVQEGWADHTALRLALHRALVTGEWSGLQYETYLNGLFRPHRTGSRVRDAVIEPTGGPFEFYPDPSVCGDENHPTLRYTCGNIMQRIYWELAWNACRAPYGSCNDGETIIKNGIFANQAWKLVNSAFAYALSNMSPGGTIGEFFDHVIARYRIFRVTNQYFEWEDYTRVNEVLARHCLGWADHCSADTSYHHLPGHELPWIHAFKTGFSAGYDAHHLWAELMTRTSASRASFGTVDGLGYVELRQRGSSVESTVDFIAPGDYRVKAAIRRLGGGSAMRVSVGKLGPITWSAGDAPPGQWAWTNGPIFTVSQAVNTVRIERLNDVDIQAVIIERLR